MLYYCKYVSYEQYNIYIERERENVYIYIYICCIMQKNVSESVATFILKKTKPMPAQVLKVAAIDTLTTLSSAGRIATLAGCGAFPGKTTQLGGGRGGLMRCLEVESWVVVSEKGEGV